MFGISNPHKLALAWVMEDSVVELLAHSPVFDWDIVEVGSGVKPLGDVLGDFEWLDVAP